MSFLGGDQGDQEATDDEQKTGEKDTDGEVEETRHGELITRDDRMLGRIQSPLSPFQISYEVQGLEEERP